MAGDDFELLSRLRKKRGKNGLPDFICMALIRPSGKIENLLYLTFGAVDFFVMGIGLEDIIIAISRERSLKAVSKLVNKLIKKGKIKNCESKDFIGVNIDDIFSASCCFD